MPDLEAGRALDALIAQMVFGSIGTTVVVESATEDGYNRSQQLLLDIPPYSTDIAAAWAVLDKLRHWPAPSWMASLAGQTPWEVSILGHGLGFWRVTIYHPTLSIGSEENTLPLAICRAALKAVSAEIPAP